MVYKLGENGKAYYLCSEVGKKLISNVKLYFRLTENQEECSDELNLN